MRENPGHSPTVKAKDLSEMPTVVVGLYLPLFIEVASADVTLTVVRKKTLLFSY